MASDNITKWTESEIEGLKSFDIDDLVGMALKEIYVEKNYEELRKAYLKSSIETIANSNDYYSVGGGKFVYLKDASMQDLRDVADKFDRNIKGLKRTLKRVLMLEQEVIRGQLAMTFEEDGTVNSEIQEKKSLAEQLEDAIKALEA